MSVLRAIRQETGGADLMVLLPGAQMRPEDFAESCFGEVTRRGIALDLVAVDLGPDTVGGNAPLEALQAQILAPARPRYRRTWLGGISLGGFIALAHAAETPESVDGLCLIAPYPGNRLTLNAITRAGGVDAWQPARDALADPEVRVWNWLKAPPPGLPVFVGYGSDDRFARGMEMLAGRFPPDAHHTVPGGHDWPTWRRLWADFLDLGYFST